MGYRVIRESDGTELGRVVPAPVGKWTVWAGDGKSYNTRVEAAGSIDHAAVEIPTGNREWRYGDIVVVDNRKLDRVQMVFPREVPRKKQEHMLAEGFHWHAEEGAWQRSRSKDSLECALRMARHWSKASKGGHGRD